jgi:hypothetical protein
MEGGNGPFGLCPKHPNGSLSKSPFSFLSPFQMPFLYFRLGWQYCSFTEQRTRKETQFRIGSGSRSILGLRQRPWPVRHGFVDVEFSRLISIRLGVSLHLHIFLARLNPLWLSNTNAAILVHKYHYISTVFCAIVVDGEPHIHLYICRRRNSPPKALHVNLGFVEHRAWELRIHLQALRLTHLGTISSRVVTSTTYCSGSTVGAPSANRQSEFGFFEFIEVSDKSFNPEIQDLGVRAVWRPCIYVATLPNDSK